MTDQFVVHCRVVADDKIVPNVAIDVIDRDVRSEALLGSGVTDAQGACDLTYTREQFVRGDKGSANLFFLVRTGGRPRDIAALEVEGGVTLDDGLPIFDAPAELTVIVHLNPEPAASEYERLQSLISPPLDGLPPEQLQLRDIPFLAADLDMRGDSSPLLYFVAGARLSQETGIRPEPFYAWARMNMPDVWAPLKSAEDEAAFSDAIAAALLKLVGTDVPMLAGALQNAASENIVPSWLAAQAGDLATLVQRYGMAIRRIALLAVNQASGAPIAGATVETTDQKSNEPLGGAVTDAVGRFDIDVYVARDAADIAVDLAFTVKVTDSADRSVNMSVPLASDEPVVVLVPDDAALIVSVEEQMPPQLRAQLAQAKVVTLGDIRRRGGLSDIQSPYSGIVERLEILAELDRLGLPIAQAVTLMGAGFHTLKSIADATLDDLASVGTQLDLKTLGLAKLKSAAAAQTAFLNNVVGGIAAEQSNGYDLLSGPAMPLIGLGATPEGAGSTAGADQGACGCEACDDALSPVAYLTVLVDYTLRRVQIDSEALDAATLTSRFHQPFLDLATDCAAVTQPVAVARLAVEALRDEIGPRPVADSTAESALVAGEKSYVLAAYDVLLGQLGTNQFELRRTRNASADDRGALAARLGLILSTPRPDPASTPGDELDQLLLDPALSPADPRALTEATLDRLFGLRDTTGDRLSQSVVLDDPNGQLQHWRFDNLVWNRHTDGDGLIYGQILDDQSDIPPDTYGVYLFRDPDFQQPVATAETHAATAPLKFSPVKQSGFTGSARLNYVADVNIRISAVPLFAAWRHKALRASWKAQDFPANALPDARPTIDPFVVLAADLVSPFQGSAAFDVWNVRTNWVKTEAATLRNLRAAPAAPAAALAAMVAAALAELDPQVTSLDALRALQGRRAAGEDVGADMRMLGLTPGSLTFLTDFAASIGTAAQPPAEHDWQIVEATLVRIAAQGQFKAWRNQEAQAGITLSPDFFRTAETEGDSDTGPVWLDTTQLRRDWTDLLASRAAAANQIGDELASSVSAVEQQTLPLLRDALVDATDAEGTSTVDKAEWLGRRLLLDLRADGSTVTTRVEQATETLQTLLFGLRTGQFQQDGPSVYDSIVSVAASTMGADRIDLFGRTKKDQLWQLSRIGTRWGTWRPRGPFPNPFLSGGLAPSDISAIGSPDRIDLVLMGPDACMWHRPWREGWAQWQKIGAELIDNRPTLMAMAGQINAFATRQPDYIVERRELLAGWSAWTALDAATTSRYPVAAASSAPGRIDLIVSSWNAGIVTASHRWFDGTWHNLALDGTLDGEPALISSEPGRLDLVQNFGGKLYHRFFSGSWQPWTNVDANATPAETLSGTPAIVSSAAGGLEAFAIRQGGVAARRYTGTTGWGDWTRVPLSQLQLHAPDFDREWPLLGSYSAWRSSAFIFFAPENLLEPSLRSHQSPVFLDIVSDTQASATLSVSDVCTYVGRYQDYLKDVVSLEIQATCQAFVNAPQSQSCTPGAASPQSLTFLFGLSRSGKVYFSTIGPEDQSGFAQSFWEEVPLTSGADSPPKVSSIIGALPWQNDGAGAHFIYLVLDTEDPAQFATDGRKLLVARYDIDQFGTSTAWPANLSEIRDMPRPYGTPLAFSSLTVRAVQNDTITEQPRLAFHDQAGSQQVWGRPISLGGDALEGAAGDWTPWKVTPQIRDTQFYRPDTVEWLEAALYVGRHIWLVYETQGYHHVWCDQMLGCYGIDNGASRLNGVLPGYYPGGSSNSSIFVFYTAAGQVRYRQCGVNGAGAVYPPPSSLQYLVVNSGSTGKHMLAYTATSKDSFVHAYNISGDELNSAARRQIVPRIDSWVNLPVKMGSTELQYQASFVRKAFLQNITAPPSVLAYLEEAFGYLALHLAGRLRQSGNQTAALDLYRTLFDYNAPNGMVNIYYGLVLDQAIVQPVDISFGADWLKSPLDPFEIARNRRYALTRFVLASMAACLIEKGDADFTIDAIERARLSYQTALDLLSSPFIGQNIDGCDDHLSELVITPGMNFPDEAGPAVSEIVEELTHTGAFARFGTSLFLDVQTTLHSGLDWSSVLTKLQKIAADAIATVPPPLSVGDAIAKAATLATLGRQKALTLPGVDAAVQNAGKLAQNVLMSNLQQLGALQTVELDEDGNVPDVDVSMDVLSAAAPDGQMLSALTFSFCVPPNPNIKSLRLKAQLSLDKLRAGRNIAGLKRDFAPYEGVVLGMGTSTTALSPYSAGFKPTLYRYSTLVDRAKQAVALGAQIEADLLQALFRRDDIGLALLRARQDVGIADANVQLQDLQLVTASAEVQLANLQKARAQTQATTYQSWIDAGPIKSEMAMFDAIVAHSQAMTDVARFQTVQSVFNSFFTDDPMAFLGGFFNAAVQNPQNLEQAQDAAAGAEADIQINQFYASYDRKVQEWQLAVATAQADQKIADQQTEIARDGAAVVTQQRTIAQLQSQNASAIVDYLSNGQFGTFDQLDWMVRILSGVLRFFLQQATATARLAERQLAFEEQEPMTGIIAADYWTNVLPGATDSQPKVAGGDQGGRNGTTGSARLTEDIARLDQHAFDIRRRRMPITKSISLARLAPAEFVQFRETGVLAFSTTMDLFDRDFPGHYLRLIQRVRTSVIAVVPPVDGIKATLASTGISRVVIGDGSFSTITLRRDPEIVAISAALDSGGYLDPSDEAAGFYFPFEGNGVDSSWEFRMPRPANAVDLSAVTDVILTIEYTALDDATYRDQVQRRLGTTTRGDRGYSLRMDFPDAWYELNNSDILPPDQRLKVAFQTHAADLPPNTDGVRIENLVVGIIRGDGFTDEIGPFALTLDGNGGSATTVGGSVSTRRANGASLLPINGHGLTGQWVLDFSTGTPGGDEDLASRFEKGDIEDIILQLSFVGQTPPWPK